MESLERVLEMIYPLNQDVMSNVKKHVDQLTKPVGSLGRIEEIAVQLAGITHSERPTVESPAVIIAAADHGIASEGVSAYPQDVTKLMIQNFLQGGAAINVFARLIGASVRVVDIGVNGEIVHPELIAKKIKNGTNNFLLEDAMTIEEAVNSIEIGIEQATELIGLGHKLLIIGEMGIANTSASSALISAFTSTNVRETVGRGTGLDKDGFERKIEVIEQALINRRINPANPLETLAKIGGLEIGMLTGVLLGASANRTPVIVDGLISSAAALVAAELCPAVKDYLIISHQSAEPGHAAVFSYLQHQPLLSLELRLGEGTGAALAYPLLDAATKMLKEMATFADLGIEKQEAAID